MLFAKRFNKAVRRRNAACVRRRLAIESLEQRLAMAVTMTIDPTALGLGPNYGVWVSGFANAQNAGFQWLETSGSFGTPSSVAAGQQIPLLSITQPTQITFDGANELAGGQLQVFVSALSTPPTAPQLSGAGPAWSVTTPPTAPYANSTTIGNYGTVTPFDIVEFTYSPTGNSTFNLSAVNAFGIPMTLESSATGTSVGIQKLAGYSRDKIGQAFTHFMSSDPLGTEFTQLLYGPGASSPFIAPPTTPASQFFSIVNPWYWLNNQPAPQTPSGLLSYWDTTLEKFFQSGNTLSINLGGRVWEGTASSNAYVFSKIGDSGAGTVTVSKPASGFDAAAWVFGNVFPAGFDPTVAGGDAGLIVDNIWEALNRGVALEGVLAAPAPSLNIVAAPNGASMVGSGPNAFDATITTTSNHGYQAGDVVEVSNVVATANSFFPNGYNGIFTVKSVTDTTITYFIAPTGSGTPVGLPNGGGGTVRQIGGSTPAWNDSAAWYLPNQVAPLFPGFDQVYNTYAKFLHYSTLDGKDSRSGGTPIFINNQAYGFGEDENPNGPYGGGEVPSKFDGTITQGSTLTLSIDPWLGASSAIGIVSGDFDGNGLTDIAELKTTGQWEVALTPTTGTPTTVNAGSPWSTAPTWSDFTVVRDTTTDRDVVIARASNSVDGSWWKLSLDGSTWNTSFVGSWGIPDQWVDIVSGDFDGDGSQDIAGRWLTTGAWWMLADAAAVATIGDYAAKNVAIGQWNPGVTWSQVVAGNFTGDASGKDTIAGLTGTNWWLLERSGGSSTNTLMTSSWSAGHTWVDYQVGNFSGAANGEEQIAARSGSSGAWYLLGKSGSSFAVSSMQSWNPAATWLNVVAGDFDGNGTADIAGRNQATNAWTVLGKTGTSFTNTDFGGAWPTSSVWGKAFAGIYNQQASSPKKSGILGRSVSETIHTWELSVSSGTAFTSAPAPGYPS